MNRNAAWVARWIAVRRASGGPHAGGYCGATLLRGELHTDGATNPNGNSALPSQLQSALPAHPAATPALLNSHFSLQFVAASHGPPAYSEPAYIRHLALLI